MTIQISGGVSFHGNVQVVSYLPPVCAPTNISVTQNNMSSVNIGYTVAPSSPSITAITAYSIPVGVVTSISTSGSGSVVIGNLSSGTNYSWYLTACNPGGASPRSTVSNIVLLNSSGGVTSPSTQYSVPSVPVISLITSGTNSISVNYTTSTNNGGTPVVSYTAVFVPPNYGQIYTQTINTSSSGTFVFSNINPNNSFNVNLYSTNLAGVSPTATYYYLGPGIPSAPFINSATIGSNNSVAVISYQAPFGASNITGYTAISTPGCYVGYSSTAGSITISGIQTTGINTNYTFKVYATNLSGQGSYSLSSNSILAKTCYPVNYLIVAGGGGGGNNGSGAGGAGGALSGSIVVNSGTTYPITVGAGAVRVPCASANYLGANGFNGCNSTGFGLTAVGGGGGGTDACFSQGGPGIIFQRPGLAGGSGGGAAGRFNGYSAGANAGGAGTPGQGYPGGNICGGGINTGGGGAGGPGFNTGKGCGGTGTFTTLISTTAAILMGIGQYVTATNLVWFAGGGGACSTSTGGYGGGGGGINPGAPYTGGGGGGGGFNPATSGGSGVTIISVPSALFRGTYTGTATIVTTYGLNTVIVFKAGGSFIS